MVIDLRNIKAKKVISERLCAYCMFPYNYTDSTAKAPGSFCSQECQENWFMMG